MRSLMFDGGIYPIVSKRNAVFMNSEVSGVEVSQEVSDRYEGLNREEAEDLAVQFAPENAGRMLPDTAGWYLVIPFKWIALMERVLAELQRYCERSEE